MTMTRSYRVDDQHGTNLCGGIGRHGIDCDKARRIAQRWANDLRAPVLLYVDGDDGEVIEPEQSDGEAQQ